MIAGNRPGASGRVTLIDSLTPSRIVTRTLTSWRTSCGVITGTRAGRPPVPHEGSRLLSQLPFHHAVGRRAVAVHPLRELAAAQAGVLLDGRAVLLVHPLDVGLTDELKVRPGHPRAAVDRQARAGDEGRGVGEVEQDRRGHLARLAVR